MFNLIHFDSTRPISVQGCSRCILSEKESQNLKNNTFWSIQKGIKKSPDTYRNKVRERKNEIWKKERGKELSLLLFEEKNCFDLNPFDKFMVTVKKV